MYYDTFYSFRHAGMTRQEAGLLDRQPAAVSETRRRRHGHVPHARRHVHAADISRSGCADGPHHLHQSRPRLAAAVSATRTATSGSKRAGPQSRKSCASRSPPIRCARRWDEARLWRLISQLSLNYLSLVEEGKEALQEILKLYNFTIRRMRNSRSRASRRLRSRKHFARVISENGITFARGVRVEMELDEEQFVGGGSYLFGSVLEHFLGMYVSHEQLQPVDCKIETKEGVDPRMAATSGTQDPDVAPNSNAMAMEKAGVAVEPAGLYDRVKKLLETVPQEFDFFQAVRLFERVYPGRRPVGALRSAAARSGAVLRACVHGVPGERHTTDRLESESACDHREFHGAHRSARRPAAPLHAAHHRARAGEGHHHAGVLRYL